MGQSYRLKATPGKDQNLLIQVDQDFEQLEILSLKIRQGDVYLRMCSDYGVIAGRVYSNNGYGIPNAKVSIFIPVTDEDLSDPIISGIYPYKTLLDVNEDGYKYNLLPYSPSYNGHIPTGTFPTRNDVLLDPSAKHIYNRYYKYTVQTNDSGDYLIYGVPVGTQTIVMNVDLSDIGPFSLSPQDLVRMGVASENQFNGSLFTSSPNFEILPQVIVINKTIEVVPFWGEQDVCQIGITRTDFDITTESNIDIRPTSVFMGSLISTSSTLALKQNCVAKKETGNLCQMTTGPGEIIAITQTIKKDDVGLPILERAVLPNGGKLIDSDGTWLFDLPMNSDYITTNEYGEQIISNDPSVGIPTKAKYRFKFKWQQSKNINEDYRRGYFIVPNIKEKGWQFYGADPLNSVGSPAYNEAITTYAFDLGWSGYTTGAVDLTNTELVSYINCEDRFYSFDYNKVYTVSGLIDNFKKSNQPQRFLGIKQINDSTCDSEVNKFPVNDGVLNSNLQWILYDILFTLISSLATIIILIYPIVAFQLNLYYYVISSFLCYACGIKIAGVRPFGKICSKLNINCDEPKNLLRSLKLPMLTYPNCETCDCTDDADNDVDDNKDASVIPNATPIAIPFNTHDGFVELDDEDNFNNLFLSNINFPYTDKDNLKQMLGGRWNTTSNVNIKGGVGTIGKYFTSDLPFGERINLYNTKYSFYNGSNQIRVSYETLINPGVYHHDNIIAVIVDESVNLVGGNMFSFINPASSLDPNYNSAPLNTVGSHSLSGITTIPTELTFTVVNQSNPTLSNNTVVYQCPDMYNANKDKTIYYTYPTDIEYYQVITTMDISDFRGLIPTTRYFNSLGDLIESTTTIKNVANSNTITVKPIDGISQNHKILIIQRGVDPNSFLVNTTFDLSRVIGHTTFGQTDCIISGNYRVNFPIRNTDDTSLNEIMFDHNFSVGIDNNTENNGFNLFFQSQFFEPSINYVSYNTKFHNYYSNLDYKLINSSPLFQSLSTSSFTILDSSKIESGGSSYLYVKPHLGNLLTNNLGVIENKYNYSIDQLMGGSYMYLDSYNNSFYYSPVYSKINNLTMSYYKNMVMRSDRLPTSDTQTTDGNNNYLLQQNPNLTFYKFTNNGVVSFKPTISIPQISDPLEPGLINDQLERSVLSTLDCGNMVDFYCYTGSGLNVGYDPKCAKENPRVVNGCYRFCRACDDRGNVFGPLLGIPSDLAAYFRYIFRFKFFLGLCQGALSEVFNNNWVNGVLFAYPFKISNFYSSENKINRRKFCTNVIMLHPKTNNFYYRCSPWDGTKFIGQKSPGSTSKGSNDTNLKYPTTIINMGPKYAFLKEIILNGNFDGYIMDQFGESSYNDTSDIVNLFSIIRLTNPLFLNNLTGSGVASLFSRNGRKVDADYAQSAAINTQIGIIPLDTESYSSTPPNAPIIAATTLNFDIMLGVMFSATTDSIQIRDYISPVRSIRWNSTINSFAYDYTAVNSQLTPHYKWHLYPGGTLFGTSLNEWVTSPSEIFSVKYQEIDRLNSPYPKWNEIPNQYNARGYMYGDDSDIFTETDYNYTAQTIRGHKIPGGAPWYFYFGLKKGKTAMNKFITTYMGDTDLNE